MDFEFTQEHDELRQTVKRFLDNDSTEQKVRGLMSTDDGYDREVWKKMAEQMGLQALIVPEEHGGAGMGLVELSVVLEEMGAALLCAPFLSTAVLAPTALLRAGDAAACADILPGIAAGETIATVAIAEPNSGWDLARIATTATADGAAWRLDGEKSFVLDGHTADVLLVAAKTADGLGLFRVEGVAAGLERRLLPTLDLTRKLASVKLTGVRATRVGSGDATAVLEHVLRVGAIALACEQVGGAQRVMQMAVEYAKTRLQFGRPIGSFQAIKHRCADMLVDVELARSAAYHAAFAAADGREDELPLAVHMAKSFCSEAYFRIANDNIQVHGGMGFTWEHPAHLYFKRAKSSAVLFGSPSSHREKVAERIGL
jgi:alkylation response protein AidB-like acyl-CoA dehydrogenase